MKVNYIKRFNGALVGALLFAFAVVVQPVSAAVTQFSFTQAELDASWGPERIEPSGGYGSVATFEGRSNVAKINIDSTDASLEPYYRLEGIKTPKNTADSFAIGGNLGQSVQVDLFLDPEWNTNAARAGLWTVGDNGSNGTDPVNYPFGIIEFASIENYQGFRYYDPTVGYVQIPGFDQSAGYGKWVTLKITLDPITDRYVYSINGTQVGSSQSPVASTYFHSVMLNHRNFGRDTQQGLTNESYSIHWHGGVVKPTVSSKDECKSDGWKSVVDKNGNTFKNQGQCVASVTSSEKSKLNH